MSYISAPYTKHSGLLVIITKVGSVDLHHYVSAILFVPHLRNFISLRKVKPL